MAFYGIRDVERLLNVKVHVLRYWEQEIPLIQPKKDVSGKLRYSSRDLQIFLRLKYLLYNRHFTVEGAREELFREAAGDHQDLRAGIAALRSDLVDLCFLLNNKDAPKDAPGDPNRRFPS